MGVLFIMNKVITIGREFGSGGREFGKRLADYLGIAYYDKEIITEISKKTKLAEEYIQKVIENKPSISFPITIGNSFYAVFSQNLECGKDVYAEQSNTLVEMVQRSNCVIIGRCADYILEEYNPIKIFTYADMKSKIKRCIEKASKDEHLSEKEIKQQIQNIDKNRSKYYQFITGKKWGDKCNYDICVNTTNISIKDIAKSIAFIIKPTL